MQGLLNTGSTCGTALLLHNQHASVMATALAAPGTQVLLCWQYAIVVLPALRQYTGDAVGILWSSTFYEGHVSGCFFAVSRR